MQSLPSNGAAVFAGGSTGAYRSDNSAASFTSSNSGNDPIGPTRGFTSERTYVYTCTSQGVHRSSNDGAIWTPKNTGRSSLLCHGIIQVQSKLFVAGVAGVFRSDNQGDSWTPLACGLSSGSYRGFAHDERLIVAGSFGGSVFYSVDNGDEWTLINVGLTDPTIFDMEIHQGFIVAATNTQGVFRYAIFNTLNIAGDACIDAADLAVLLGAWGTCSDCAADFNGDNAVDAADPTILLSNWAACGS